MKCHWCNEPLVFKRGRGWVHLEGGTCKVLCRSCGWTGAPDPSPTKCPQCGSKEIMDDHCAFAVPDEA